MRRVLKTPPDLTDISTLLVQLRSERNLTLEDVAKATGLATMTICDLERASKSPRRTTILKIQNFLRKHGYFPKEAA